MMSGNSAIEFRNYERAVERLKAIYEQLATEEGRNAALDKIKIGLERDLDSTLPGMRHVAKAVAEAMRADVPKYLSGLIGDAQADVRTAADVLVSAIKADLNSRFMTKPKGD
jgi:hypothetical protein